MKSYLLLSLLVLSLVLSSCSGTITTVPDQTAEMYPLAVGANWEYTEVETDGDKTETKTVIDMVVKDSLIEGIRYFSMGDDVWFTNQSDGLYTHSKGKKEKKCKYPIKVGDDMDSDFGKYKIKVEALNVSVKIKSGTYNCIKYKLEITEGQKNKVGYYHLKIESFRSPGIGMIKYTRLEEGFDYTRTRYKELIRYKIK